MKKVLICLVCIVLILCAMACGKTKLDESTIISETECEAVDPELIGNTSEEENMKMFINEIEIPVIWEQNDSVAEIMETASRGDIVISMSMYGGNEQVGSLGKRYSSSDKQTTTHNGDIVLYNSSNIVLFYGSNSWSYTRLGKMDLPKVEVTELLSNGNVSVRITSDQN